MNENVRIQVYTPVGPTKQADTCETLGQGSVEGAVASAANLARRSKISLKTAKMKFITMV